MLTYQEILFQIESLKGKGLSLNEISGSFDASVNISPREVEYVYKHYILPFEKLFDSIIKKLQWDHVENYRKECKALLYLALSQLRKQTKFRNISLLTPIVIFMVLRSTGEIIKLREFCQATKITTSDFKEGLFLINPLCPNYLDYIKRDREKFVSQRIDKMIQKFSLDSNFKEMTTKMIKTFLPLLKNRIDNVVAGLIITLSFVALDQDFQQLHGILNALGASVDRFYEPIRNMIFLPNHLGHFKGFKKSREQLKQFLLTSI